MPSGNIILIGMPGAGKSTLGVILAKHAGLAFVDTDLLIQSAEKRSLQEIVDTEGHLTLRAIEERILLGIDDSDTVIATGGSAAYSAPAMEHLKNTGVVVFLDIPLPELERRVTDYQQRGLAKRPDQTFADLFAERRELYQKYADVTVDTSGMRVEEGVSKIMELATNSVAS